MNEEKKPTYNWQPDRNCRGNPRVRFRYTRYIWSFQKWVPKSSKLNHVSVETYVFFLGSPILRNPHIDKYVHTYFVDNVDVVY